MNGTLKAKSSLFHKHGYSSGALGFRGE